MDNRPYADLDDQQLERAIEYQTGNVAANERDLQVLRDNLAAMREEANRRALVLYFMKHPQLEPVAVGDEIEELDEFWRPNALKYEVSEIDPSDERGVIRYFVEDGYNPKYIVNIPLAELSAARRKYLDFLRDNPPTTHQTKG